MPIKVEKYSNSGANQSNDSIDSRNPIFSVNAHLKELPDDSVTPHWIDNSYSYDSRNPRKPNVKEFVEAMTGIPLQELVSKKDTDWQGICQRASDLLYNVAEDVRDSRDWNMIMSSEDVLSAAREATGQLHEPKLDIDISRDPSSYESIQKLVLKNSDGQILDFIPPHVAEAKELLDNYGVSSDSIPKDILSDNRYHFVEDELLKLLQSYTGLLNTNLRNDQYLLTTSKIMEYIA